MLLFVLLVLSAIVSLSTHRVSASFCPITVSYELSLGQAPLTAASRGGSAGGPNDFSDIPIFFAKIGVFSNNVRRTRPPGQWCMFWNMLLSSSITHLVSAASTE